MRKEGVVIIGFDSASEFKQATAAPLYFTHTTHAPHTPHRQDRITETLSRPPGQRRPRVRRAFRKQATRLDKGKREEAKPCRPPCLIIHTIFREVRTHNTTQAGGRVVMMQLLTFTLFH